MIKIICVGKIKEKFFKDAICEYKLRIGKYTRIEIIELMDCNYDVKKTLREEYNSIMKVFNKSDYNILLDIGGIQMDSISLSRKIDSVLTNNNSNITFIVGGSYGVFDDLREKCDLCLSFSKLTFPHQLFRVILLEQIYRVFKIINNEEYHK